MAKLGNPLGAGKELWITQTYHTGSNNTAIDISATAGTPVFAMADGIVNYRSSGAGSYCIQALNNSALRSYNVHTYNWVNANTSVANGQKICEVAPTSLNGGYPTHLHLGLPTGFNIMDYFDRGIVFRTKYQAIKDIWFIGENLDWSKFKDLNYDNTNMAFKIGDKIEFTGVQNMRKGSGTSFPVTGSTAVGMLSIIEDGPRVANGYTWYDLNNGDWVADVNKFKLYVKPVEPPVDPQPTECEKQVIALQAKNLSLETTLEAREVQLEMVMGERDKLLTRVDGLEGELAELNGSYQVLKSERDRLEIERNEVIREFNEYKLNSQQSFIDKIKDFIGEVLAKILNR